MPERVRAMNSSVRLLLIVREPVTRAISDYTQLRSRATPSAPAHAMTPSHPAPDATKPFEHLAISPDGSINIAYRLKQKKFFFKWQIKTGEDTVRGDPQQKLNYGYVASFSRKEYQYLFLSIPDFYWSYINYTKTLHKKGT